MRRRRAEKLAPATNALVPRAHPDDVPPHGLEREPSAAGEQLQCIQRFPDQFAWGRGIHRLERAHDGAVGGKARVEAEAHMLGERTAFLVDQPHEFGLASGQHPLPRGDIRFVEAGGVVVVVLLVAVVRRTRPRALYEQYSQLAEKLEADSVGLVPVDAHRSHITQHQIGACTKCG